MSNGSTELEKCLAAAGQNGWIVERRRGHLAFLKGTRVVVVSYDDAGTIRKVMVGIKPVLRGNRLARVLRELRK